MKKDVIIGYSGHAFVVLDILKSCNINVLAYCEHIEKQQNPYNLVYWGYEKNSEVLNNLQNCNVYLGIGSNLIRKNIYYLLHQHNISMPLVIHKNATVSTLAKIDLAAVIMPGVVINSMSTIGKGVICNSSSIIEHECELADFVHIAPGATLAGNVKVGQNSFVGANAVIKEGVVIGSNVIIGAGSVVINNIPDGKKIVGNPCRFI